MMRRRAGQVVLTVALLVMVAAVLRFMYGPPLYPSFRNYGVVHTSVGLAVVACGGKGAGQCGSTTAIIFTSCSPQWRDYFAHTSDPTSLDRLVRTLIGKRPPSGNRWVAYCGAAHEMFQGQPLAKLKSN